MIALTRKGERYFERLDDYTPLSTLTDEILAALREYGPLEDEQELLRTLELEPSALNRRNFGNAIYRLYRAGYIDKHG